MKTPHPTLVPDLTPAQVCQCIIDIGLAGLDLEAKWMAESAQIVADRIKRDGICGLSLLADVEAHVNNLRRRIQRVETLRAVLPRS